MSRPCSRVYSLWTISEATQR